jgi:PLP dependent protein
LGSIATNIKDMRERIGGNTRLIVITKGRSLAEINEAISAGITEIGENRVQEAAEKLPLLPKNIIRHMVGHLQSNKVKDAVALFDVIQSVDSVKLAAKIAKEATAQKKRIIAYLQVNVSGKGTQGGFSAGEIEGAAMKIRAMQSDYFAVEGLMVIASKENAREDFRKAGEICGKLGLPVFSAGMSGDYKIAVGEGSNMVRIGGAIFSRERNLSSNNQM